MTPAEIAKRFDISIPAAKIRAAELQRIQRKETGQRRALLAGVLEFLKEQKRKGFDIKSI
jgi:hypothetical protein